MKNTSETVTVLILHKGQVFIELILKIKIIQYPKLTS